MLQTSLNTIDLLVLAKFRPKEKKIETSSVLSRIQNQLNKGKGSIIKYCDFIDFEKLGIVVQGKVHLSISEEHFGQLIKNHPRTIIFQQDGIEQDKRILVEMGFRHQQECRSFLTELEQNCSFINKSLFNVVRDTKSEEYLYREYEGPGRNQVPPQTKPR